MRKQSWAYRSRRSADLPQLFAGCDSAFTPRDSREFVVLQGAARPHSYAALPVMQRLTSGVCWVDGEIWQDETMCQPHSSTSHRGCISAADFSHLSIKAYSPVEPVKTEDGTDRL